MQSTSPCNQHAISMRSAYKHALSMQARTLERNVVPSTNEAETAFASCKPM